MWFNEARWHGSRALVPSREGFHVLPHLHLSCHQTDHPLANQKEEKAGHYTNPKNMVPAWIWNHCLKHEPWVNHHTPFLTIWDGKKPVLPYPQGWPSLQTPEVRQTWFEFKELKGRFTGPYFSPGNIRQFICTHFSPLRPNFLPFPLICSSFFPISLI